MWIGGLVGETRDGRLWCDFDGKEIFREPVREKDWTFHSQDCRDNKLRLLHKADQEYGKIFPIRSIYKAFQEGEE